MLVQERGWSSETYANWLYEMLANSLLHVSEEHPDEEQEVRAEERPSVQR